MGNPDLREPRDKPKNERSELHTALICSGKLIDFSTGGTCQFDRSKDPNAFMLSALKLGYPPHLDACYGQGFVIFPVIASSSYRAMAWETGTGDVQREVAVERAGEVNATVIGLPICALCSGVVVIGSFADQDFTLELVVALCSGALPVLVFFPLMGGGRAGATVVMFGQWQL